MNSIFWLLFPPSPKLATNSWKLHNSGLLKALIELKEDAISHALGLNYGIISECIIKYLALENHYHMLCMNLNHSASSGLRRTNGNEILHSVPFQFQWTADLHTCHPAARPKSVYHGGLQVLINWICSIYSHWTGQTKTTQSTTGGRCISQNNCLACCLKSEEDKDKMAAGGCATSLLIWESFFTNLGGIFYSITLWMSICLWL